MSYQYRCRRCRITSHRVHSRDALDHIRRDHREQIHGGHIPDGEREIKVRTRLGDLPIQYWAIAAAVLAILFGPALLDRL
ncbi:hypothetical protein ACIBSV_46875 [Embleya sp. NPDC050154]|uniref:hypothetical protein n=1 Tax=Embleya sp. NPDC050154 TaxID=3363988 RepID=UPI0037B45D44